jgi:uncharacterized protein YndB with AHSA1/START domain
VIPISASTVVPVPPAATFAFLHQPHNHRRLVTRRIRLITLDVDASGELRGALMELHGPFGLRRPVRTRLLTTRAPERLAGTALLEGGTEIAVCWDLHPAAGGATRVTLSARVWPSTPVDGLRLRAGGAAWARRLFTDTLTQLSDALGRHGGQSATLPRAANQSVSCATAIGRASRYPWAISQP